MSLGVTESPSKRHSPVQKNRENCVLYNSMLVIPGEGEFRRERERERERGEKKQKPVEVLSVLLQNGGKSPILSFDMSECGVLRSEELKVGQRH